MPDQMASIGTRQICVNRLDQASSDLKGDLQLTHLKADLSTGEGLQEALETLGPVDIVVNCAAISSPAACEKHPVHARCAFGKFDLIFMKRF